jgi:hypothetical protein
MRECSAGCDVGVGDAITVFDRCAFRWCNGNTGGAGEVCILFFVHFHGWLDSLEMKGSASYCSLVGAVERVLYARYKKYSELEPEAYERRAE